MTLWGIVTPLSASRRQLAIGASAFALAIAAQPANAQAQAAASPPPPTNAVTAPAPSEAAMADIVVTGTRLGKSGFTAPTPVTVIGEQKITALASTNLGDVLDRLPAFRTTTA